MMQLNPSQGKSYPLGAHWDGQGTNFALFSEHATGVKLCLFNDLGQEHQISMFGPENHIWHAYLPDISPGQQYGYRVEGPHQPEQGHRFNSSKLLIDPYARAIAGDVIHGPEIFGYPWGDANEDLTISRVDDASQVPKSVVIDDRFDWEGDRPLQHSWQKTIIYEVHVKGFTQQHPDIPESLQGTYAGLAHPAAIAHLKSLGITAIELLPIHHFFLHSGLLAQRGLSNYWGYDTLGFFAPYSGYSASGHLGEQVREFKTMVKALHQAGIEVILDVVYNHTGEGDHMGPTLSLRGVDNAAYYRLNEDNPRYQLGEITGCGNCLHTGNPQVLKLVLDSLRYWVEEMHVDGFRFDEAPALARVELLDIEVGIGGIRERIKILDHEFDPWSPFFAAIHQDPALSQTKLIAEPWDAGNNGYQLGNFPVLWREWNEYYRDALRDFWRGESITFGEWCEGVLGSRDLFSHNGRNAWTSVNFFACHDGFTLADLVSYNHKQNEINGEESGADNNRSWNCGVEGETDDPQVLDLRQRQKRNFIATLFLSQGIPMLLGGDEIGRSQQGNNNAYSQDNAISWFNWDLSPQDKSLLDFTRKIIEFRQDNPIFSQKEWLERQDYAWFDTDGHLIDEESHWDTSISAISLALYEKASPNIFICFNPRQETQSFRLPDSLNEANWQRIVDTASPSLNQKPLTPSEKTISTQAYSLIVLTRSTQYH